MTEIATESCAAEGTRPMRADARRNRERVLEAARAVFGEHGLDAQMDDIAARAGVGVGTVYRHFPTKEQLMGELVRQKFLLLIAHAEEAAAAEGDAFERFCALLLRNAEWIERDAAVQRTLMGVGPAVWAIAQPAVDRLEEVVAPLMDEAHADGTLRADFTVGDVGTVMCGVCATMSSPGMDWRKHLEILLDGLRSS